jgi:hypothetical protein
MRSLKSFNKRRLIKAFLGGVLCLCFFKLFLYINNREQFEDSNAFVSLVFLLIATAFILLILELISDRNSPE